MARQKKFVGPVLPNQAKVLAGRKTKAYQAKLGRQVRGAKRAARKAGKAGPRGGTSVD